MSHKVKYLFTILVMSAMLSDAELLAKLVSFDSTSHKSNLPIVDFICDYLDDSRFTIIRQLNVEGDKANVVVRVGEGATEDRAGGRLPVPFVRSTPAEISKRLGADQRDGVDQRSDVFRTVLRGRMG